MVAHTFNPWTQNAKAADLWVWGLYSEFQASQDNMIRLCLKTNKKLYDHLNIFKKNPTWLHDKSLETNPRGTIPHHNEGYMCKHTANIILKGEKVQPH